MLQNNLQKIHWWIERAFQISFFLLGILSFCAYTFGTKIMSLLVITTTISAGFCLIYRVINYKNFIKNACFWLSVAFLLSYVLSLLFNFKYGYMTPIKNLVWLGMQLTLLFTTDTNKSAEKSKQEFHIILYLFLILMALASTVSIIQLIIGYSHEWPVALEDYTRTMRAGFFWGRLWGVFSDPNYGSVMAMVSILFSLYLLRTKKQLWLKTLLYLNIPIQFFYIVFSDSRTGLVCACVAVAIYTYLILIKKPVRLALLPKNILCTILSLAMVFVVVFASNIISDGYNALITLNNQGLNSGELDSSNGTDSSDKESSMDSDNDSFLSNQNQSQTIIGRDDADINNDISNRRFDLWLSAIETFKVKPIFGFTFNNIVPAVTELLPDTYLINNDHGKFDNYHNMFFNILVGQGLFGILIFCALAIIAFIKSIKKLLHSAKHNEHYEFYAMSFTVIFMLLLSAAFISDIVYAISANAFIFWTLAGSLTKNNCNKEE